MNGLSGYLQLKGNKFPFEIVVTKSSVSDLDVNAFKRCLYRKYQEKLTENNFTLEKLLKLSIEELFNALALGLPLHQVLQNMGLASGDHLTLAGLLLFGKEPQDLKPLFNIQCVSFVGKDISSTEFRDKENIGGHFMMMFKQTVGFVNRNLRKIQKEKSFNYPGVLEVPGVVFEELIVNAMVHRDYFINSSIKLFIFDDHIEIISPGRLPNTLTIENIKNGISVARNPVLHSTAQYVLPYSGLGSGIIRALSHYSDINFENDTKGDRFKVIISRPS